MKAFIKAVVKKIPALNTICRKFLHARRRKLILDNPNLNSYEYLSVFLRDKDEKSIKGKPALKRLHKQLEAYRTQQISAWGSFVYCAGYYYQGYHKIGITGIKPTEPRMENYDVFEYFNAKGKVLDIGSNCGFLASYLSDYYKEVVGIELNPYLIKMSTAVRTHLSKNNVRFIEGNFIEYDFNETFDAVFSLSNHFTIDGNLNMDFEAYVRKIHAIMNDGGILFFESHDVNGSDKDMEEKFRVASKYFKLDKYKMVKAFYPADLDKLFAVFTKKRTVIDLHTDFNFDLEKAKSQYSFVKS